MPINKAGFRLRYQRASAVYAKDGPICVSLRALADEVRPYDPEWADALLREAEANEATRALLARRLHNMRGG